MSRNKIYLFLVVFINNSFLWAQNIVPDTVYVYEEVIVYDTIYIEKPIEKLNFENAILSFDTKTNKSILQIQNNGKIIDIPIQNTSLDEKNLKKLLKEKQKQKKYFWEYGLKFELATSKNTLFSNKNTTGLGSGFVVKHNLLNPNFFIGFSATYTHFFESINLKPNETDSPLAGYYFFDTQPKFIIDFSNKHNQISFSPQVYWKFKKFSPSIGGFYALNNYKVSFISSTGTAPQVFDRTEILTTNSVQKGYFFELIYSYHNHWDFALRYFRTTIDSLNFINNNSKFSFDANSNENGISFQVLYKFR